MDYLASADSLASEISSLFSRIDADVSLTNCDREPIQTPNLIQPHGVLLAVSPKEYRILQVSLNTSEILGIEPESLIGVPLRKLLGAEQVGAIALCLSEDFDCINPLVLKLKRNGKELELNGVVHQRKGVIIVELEPLESSDRSLDRFVDFYQLVKRPLDKLRQTSTLREFSDGLAREVKQITQFDRVMIYRFAPDGTGTVISEAVEEELTPYLGLRYPATDIPQQARHLFTLKPSRFIPDVAYEPVGIVPELNPMTGELLDMSKTDLRGVSPFHIEYLNNMEVGATLVVSLTNNGRLWGLISCHHQTAKKLSYKIRTVCEFIGQIASFELVAKEANEDLDYKMKLKSLQCQLTETISTADSLEASLKEHPQRLLDLVGASGVALCFGGKLTLLGKTPTAEFVRELIKPLERQFEKDAIYHCDRLCEVYPSAGKVADTASGLLALLVSRVQKTFIVWFRPEEVQTVTWAGTPQKLPARDEGGTLLLSPRTSFSLWRETVRQQSLPWKPCEVEAAIELRSSIVNIVLRKADELTKLNQELSRSNTELDAFAYIASHDLKEPLRGIYNYSSFLIEDYGEVLDESGVDKLNTLMRLTQRMDRLIDSLLHYSRLGRAELQLRSVNLNELVARVLEVTKASARDEQVKVFIPRSLPTVKCDRTQVNELFTNLISNGIKYNQAQQKIIEIGYLNPEDPIVLEKMRSYPDNTPTKTIFYVKDNGIGIRTKHLPLVFRIFKRLHTQKQYGGGTGAGLTIAKKIVERHRGEIWVRSVFEEGTIFYFTLE